MGDLMTSAGVPSSVSETQEQELIEARMNEAELIRLWFPIRPGLYFFDEERFPGGYKQGNWPRNMDEDQ